MNLKNIVEEIELLLSVAIEKVGHDAAFKDLKKLANTDLGDIEFKEYNDGGWTCTEGTAGGSGDTPVSAIIHLKGYDRDDRDKLNAFNDKNESLPIDIDVLCVLPGCIPKKGKFVQWGYKPVRDGNWVPGIETVAIVILENGIVKTVPPDCIRFI